MTDSTQIPHGPHIWVRREVRPTERRTPLTPEDAATLLARGVEVTVEESPQRIVPDDAYAAVGCHMVPSGSWVDAPEGAHVLGIKELPDEPAELSQTHIYFAHAYKGQEGAEFTIDRFRKGGGELLDVEYLTTEGRRVIAFGYWAGYLGAALAVLQHRGQLKAPVVPMAREDLDAQLEAGAGDEVRALVIGARGRSGRGATDALLAAGIEVTGWDRTQTAELDKDALLDFDILVNCVVSSVVIPPFVEAADLQRTDRKLRTIADVTCDVTSDKNVLPINTAITSWDEPVRRVHEGPGLPVDVIAIDNLPSLLPKEASEDFSAQLLPLIPEMAGREGPWKAARECYDKALREVPPPQ